MVTSFGQVSYDYRYCHFYIGDFFVVICKLINILYFIHIVVKYM